MESQTQTQQPDQTQDQTQAQEQGVVYVRGANGKFLPGTRAPGTIRSTARANELQRARKEKTQRLLRQQIKDQTQSRTGAKAGSSAEAVAIAGGMLWDEVVLNPDAYPRDRLEAFLRLTEKANILPAGKDQDQDQDRAPAAGLLQDLGAEAVRTILDTARQRRQQQQDQDQDQE